MTEDTDPLTDADYAAIEAVETGVATRVPKTIIPIEMEKVLDALNVQPQQVRERVAPLFWKMGWEQLCIIPTKDPKVMVSPKLIVTRVQEFPEAGEAFEGYSGYLRCEAVTEEGETVSFSHALWYTETGEKTPLSAWLTEEPPPFWARIAYIQTRKEGRHVVKPVPVDL